MIGGRLQHQVGAGLDRQAITEHGLVAQLLGDDLAHVLGIKRRTPAKRIAQVGEHDRLGARGLGLLGLEVAGLDHVAQHQVAAAQRQVGVGDRRPASGRLREPSDHRRLGQRQLIEPLVEVAARRRTDAVGSVAQKDLVEIDLEDRRLAQLGLHAHRQDRFANFAFDRALLILQEALGDLLCDRRAALHDGARADVRLHRAREPAEVDATMLVEAAILGRQERGDQRCGDVFELRVGTMLARELGEQRAVGRVDARDPGREVAVGRDAVEIRQLGREVAIRRAPDKADRDHQQHRRDEQIAKEPAYEASSRGVGHPNPCAMILGHFGLRPASRRSPPDRRCRRRCRRARRP